MLKTFDLVIIVIIAIAMTMTYLIKHQSVVKRHELRLLQEKVQLERDTINLLKADLAILSQPSRLKRLVSFYQKKMQLQLTNPVNLISPSDLLTLKLRSFPEEKEILDVQKKYRISVNWM
ncbi:hypothetical protein [Candidatus Liberibacter sp.]|uniref:cell division protein FtsL n=1 Tax=Candidatus Liberibacter sp. TaxID=34022 RepID=UPI0015F696BE|nr:hypothetical protein [Candidatus Liberibacter sp.]MBA5724062.1 hypothetical protein [Candidatus Liberibacter sp.]